MKNINIYIYSLFFMLILTSVNGQDVSPEEIDSLINETIEYNQYKELVDVDTLVIKKAMYLSEQYQYPRAYIEANKVMGHFYQRNDEALKAISYYQRGMEKLEKIEDPFFLQASLMLGLGNCYYTLGRFQLAEELHTSALKRIEQELVIDKYDRIVLLKLKNGALLNLANVQMSIGKTKEGLANQKKAYRNITPDLYKNEATYRSRKNQYAFSLGYSYLILGDANQAKPYLEEYHNDVLQRGKDAKDLAQSYGNLAYCEYLLRNFDKSYEYYDASLQLSTENGYDDVTSITYKDLSDTYHADGDLENALRYLNKHYALKDSLEGVQIQADLNSLKVKHQTSLQEQEIIRLNQQNQIQQQRTLLYASGLLLLGLLSALTIGFLILQNKRRKEQGELQRLKLANAKQELEHKKQDVTQLALQISKRYDFSQHLLKRLRTFESFIQPNAKRDWRNFEHKLGKYLQADEEQKVLQENIEEINHAFYAKLSADFPELSQSDRELCSFLRLGLSNKEIAALRGLTPEAIRSSRFRLRKKLQMDSKQDVEVFLQQV